MKTRRQFAALLAVPLGLIGISSPAQEPQFAYSTTRSENGLRFHSERGCGYVWKVIWNKEVDEFDQVLISRSTKPMLHCKTFKLHGAGRYYFKQLGYRPIPLINQDFLIFDNETCDSFRHQVALEDLAKWSKGVDRFGQ